MVCLHRNVPLIRFGSFDIGCYDESWIRSEVGSAAVRAGYPETHCSADVAESVIGFLRDFCPQNVIDLDVVADQIRCCLRAIGHPEVAGELRLQAPPVYIHLGELASRSGRGFELGFYRLFATRLELLLQPGVASVTLGGLEVALGLLVGKEDAGGSTARDELREEIVDFARRTALRFARSGGFQLAVEG